MIGVDIIDLTVYEDDRRSDNPHFVTKVLTDAEQGQCAAYDLHPETFLWSCWAAKESAYKIFARQSAMPFQPKKFDCHFTIDKPYEGTVHSEHGQCNFHIEFKDEFLYCMAYQVTSFPFLIRHFNVEDSLLPQIRGMLHQECCQYLATYFSIPADQVQIKHNTYGCPTVVSTLIANIPQVSFSHHGRYGVFAVLFS